MQYPFTKTGFLNTTNTLDVKRAQSDILKRGGAL